MERLTSRQAVKHSDGTEHIETYCHGHRYGPAAFPQKYGSSNQQEYKNYCEMVDRLAAYEDTGLEPAETPTGLELANVFAAMQELKRYEQWTKHLIAENAKLRELVGLAHTNLENAACCETCDGPPIRVPDGPRETQHGHMGKPRQLLGVVDGRKSGSIGGGMIIT